MKKRENDRKEQKVLARFAAVSFIKQQRKAGWPLSHCLKAASERPWLDCPYAVSTLEEWFYLHARGGFEALKPKGRKDRGQVRSLTPQVCSRLEQLRRDHPKFTVRSLVRQLLKEGALQPGGFSLSSIHRHLNARGLDARTLRAREHISEKSGPQKAFESPFANDLWMTDIMHGPTLAAAEGKRSVGPGLRRQQRTAPHPGRRQNAGQKRPLHGGPGRHPARDPPESILPKAACKWKNRKGRPRRGHAQTPHPPQRSHGCGKFFTNFSLIGTQLFPINPDAHSIHFLHQGMTSEMVIAERK